MKMADDPEHLRPGQREGQEDRVPGRHVGDRDAARHRLRRAVLGHGDVGGERRAAEGAKVDVDDRVAGDTQVSRYPASGLELHGVPLAVSEAQRVELEAARLGDGGGGRRVHAAAEQHHGAGVGHAGR